MSNFIPLGSSASPHLCARISRADYDPLLSFNSQVSGKEFLVYKPAAEKEREQALRRDRILLKAWHEQPVLKRDGSSLMVRQGLASTRRFELKRVVDGERIFITLFIFTTLILASIVSVLAAGLRV